MSGKRGKAAVKGAKPTSGSDIAKGQPWYDESPEPVDEHAPPPRDSHILGPVQSDSDCTSGCFRGLRWCGGVVYTCMCCPCACCGCGPIETVLEGYRAAILTYGKLERIVGPGTYHYNTCTQQFKVVSIQVQTMDIDDPPVAGLTLDNVRVTIKVVIYYRVIDVERYLFSVKDGRLAIRDFAQAKLLTVITGNSMDHLMSQRDAIRTRIKLSLARESREWGVEVSDVEVKDIRIQENLERVMAAVAEAQREGQAKIITAEAELNAATTFAEAADIMATNPLAMQLRYFQTMTEIAADNNSTYIIPSGVGDLLGNLLGGRGGGGGGEGGAAFDFEEAQKIRAKVNKIRAKRQKEQVKAQVAEERAKMKGEGVGKGSAGSFSESYGAAEETRDEDGSD